MPAKKVFIIGAGIAGIAAAIRLAVKGYKVEVFEANSNPGGKLSEVKQNGYRFDAGPSLLTLPQYIDELFELAGKRPADHFTYKRLDPICKYFYPDGPRINSYADTEKFAREIAANTNEPVDALLKHTANSADIYHITHRVFLEQSLHRLKTYLSWNTVKSIFRLPQIDAWRTMHQANEDFFKGAHMVQFFDRYATYNGSNPYTAPATLNVIPHLEQHYGAYFPTKGMYSIVTGLVDLAESVGVVFHYNSRVDEIVLEREKMKGLKVKGEVVDADIVVSNMDVWFTYNRLLKNYPKLHPPKILQQERSSSAMVFYWGIKKQFPKLDLHNIFFSADYKAEFDHIWNKKDIYHDPTIYLHISSKHKPDDAPQDCENWFVMINVPANTGQDWDMFIGEARKNILAKLSKILREDISELIICESILDPRSIETNTSSYQGSIYGTSSNSKFAAFLGMLTGHQKLKTCISVGGVCIRAVGYRFVCYRQRL